MNVMHEQIVYLFNNPQRAMMNGLWFSGYKSEGEYKEWHENGSLVMHCFYKNKNYDGEYKLWKKDGSLYIHRLYKDDKVIKDYLYGNP